MTVSIATPGRKPAPQGLLGPILAAGALTVAVVLAPFPLASVWRDGGYPNRAELVDSLSAAVVHFWSTDATATGPDLALPVAFWLRFHLVKAVLATLLLVVLVLLGRRTWGAYTRTTTAGRRVAVGGLAAAEGLLALLALLVTVANLQGAVAPLSSALGLLPLGAPDPALARTTEEIRQALAGGTPGPALQSLLADFTRYHVAMVVLGALVTAGLLASAVALWRRRVRMPAAHPRGRGLLALAAGALLLTAAFFAVVTAGNASTVADPAPALLAFFHGAG
jgi:type II secretory pathway component PulF